MDTEQRPLEGIAVLVVDDDEDARYLLDWTLQYLGALVVTVPAVPEALTTLSYFHPDVIVTDILMPHLDGLELKRQLAESTRRNVPMIAITAFLEVLELEIAEAGFSAVLRKPADMGMLARTILQLATPGR